ncbi:MAG: hypothetical protein WBM40_19750 [Thiohalocapsa sp.]
MKSFTVFTVALLAVILVLAAAAVIQTRLAAPSLASLAGEWRLSQQVTRGPFKDWVFEYQLRLRETGGRLRGEGETILVNGRLPRPAERTTVQLVDGMLRGSSVIAWVFERNGARAGRGAMRWKIAEPNLLVGHWQTTYYSGTTVMVRADAATETPRIGEGQAALDLE